VFHLFTDIEHASRLNPEQFYWDNETIFRDVSAVLAVDQQILLAADLSQKFRMTPSTGAILEP